MAIILPEHSLQEIPDLILKALALCSQKKKHPFKNVVLTTICHEPPKTRWVVCRKVTEDHNIYVFTNVSSNKVTELKEKPHCSLLFYHPKQGLQIQLSGTVTVHHQDKLTRKYWPGVQGNSVKIYTTSLAPGIPVDSINEGHQFKSVPTSEYFAALKVTPVQLVVLQLNREGHIRARYMRLNHKWEGSYLVP